MADLKTPAINYVVLSGNLTRDPAIRNTQNGNSIATFTVASNKRYRDNNEQMQEEAHFVSVIARNKLAESCYRLLQKGSAVLIEGELQSRRWKIGESNAHEVVEIKARRVQFLNKNNKSDDVSLANNGNTNSSDDLAEADTPDEPSVKS